MNQKSHVFILLGAIVAVCAVVTLGAYFFVRGMGQSTQMLFSACWQAPLDSRIIEESNGFAETWVQDGIYINASDRTIYLAANNDALNFYGTIYDCKPSSLVRIDLEQPQKARWEVMSMSHVGTATVNSGLYYLGFDGQDKVGDENHWAGAAIAAYHLNSNEIIWRQKILGTKFIDSIVASDKAIAIGAGKYHIIDPDSGEILHSLDRFASGLPGSGADVNFAYWYDYVSSDVDPLQYEPNIENIAFWAAKFERVKQSPLLSSDLILVKQYERATRGNLVTNNRDLGTLEGQIEAFDGDSGDVVWHSEFNVISNVVVANDVAFYFTDSAELIAVDVYSGEKVGSVTFSIPNVEIGEDRGYFVAVNDKTIFVYFGDSRQLFALDFFSPNQGSISDD